MRVTDSSSCVDWFSNKQEQVSSLGLSSTCGPGLQGAPPYLVWPLGRALFRLPDVPLILVQDGLNFIVMSGAPKNTMGTNGGGPKKKEITEKQPFFRCPEKRAENPFFDIGPQILSKGRS